MNTLEILSITLAILFVLCLVQWIRWFFKALKWGKEAVALCQPRARVNEARKHWTIRQFHKEFGLWVQAINKEKRKK